MALEHEFYLIPITIDMERFWIIEKIIIRSSR